MSERRRSLFVCAKRNDGTRGSCLDLIRTSNKRRRHGMRIVFVGALLAFMACGSFAHAADVAAGKEKAELCAGCHGDNGISQMDNIPSLAGQQDQFIQWQLVYFRAGSRKNEQMQPIVGQLNNEDIRNLGAYFSSLTPPKASKDDNPDLSENCNQPAPGHPSASFHTHNYTRTKAIPR